MADSAKYFQILFGTMLVGTANFFLGLTHPSTAKFGPRPTMPNFLFKVGSTEFQSEPTRLNMVKFCQGWLSPMWSNLGQGRLGRIQKNFGSGLTKPNFDRDRLDWIWPNTAKFCTRLTSPNTNKFGSRWLDWIRPNLG